jgi:hypothetical protein
VNSKTATRYLYSGIGTLILGFAAYEVVTAGADNGVLIVGVAGVLLLLQGITGST